MVWRAGCSTEALHLLNKERNEGAWVLDACLGLLVEVALVCGAASFCHHKEVIFITLHCLDVDLCREVAFCVDLIVHVKRSVLAVAEVLLSVCFVNSE